MVGKSLDPVVPVTVARPAASSAKRRAAVIVAPAEEGGVVEGAAGGVEPHHEGVVVAAVVAGVEGTGGGGEVAGPGRARHSGAAGLSSARAYARVPVASAEEGAVDQIPGIVVRRGRLPGRIDGRTDIQS